MPRHSIHFDRCFGVDSWHNSLLPTRCTSCSARFHINLVTRLELNSVVLFLFQSHHLKRPFIRKYFITINGVASRPSFLCYIEMKHHIQSDNEREFTAPIIKELGSLWSNLILVDNRPRYSQSQGSVKWSNSTFKNSLIAWMRDNKTSSWSLGLRIVQWVINTT